MEIISGVPQGSILGLLFGHLFDFCDIFLTDQFFIIKDIDIANYANDNSHMLLLIILMILSNHWKKFHYFIPMI